MKRIFYIILLLPLLCSSQVVFKGRVVKSSGKIRVGVTDETPPVIVLSGANPFNITEGGSFTEPGYTATDNVDGDITANVVEGGDMVDTNTVGEYTITYDVADVAGNNATQVTRTVNVNAAVSSVLIDDDFSTQQSDWVLINGTTISGGVLNVVANGRLQSNTANWSAGWYNLLNDKYYPTRRLRATVTARQTSGSGNFQIGQRHNVPFEQVITSSFQEYVVEYDGNADNADNNLVLGGDVVGDTFEVSSVKLEIIGSTTNPNVPGEDGSVIFFTDMDTDQWGANGEATPPTIWEVDHGDPRTTDHPSAAISTGRSGLVGDRALWLGSYNNDGTRNELGVDDLLPFGEQWIGVSVYPQVNLPDSRIIIQNRTLAAGGSNTVNAISLRHDTDTDSWYFSLPTDPTRVDQTEATLGGWNGAGTGTVSYFVDFNFQQWNDIVIHYKAGFGAGYSGPEQGPQYPTSGQTLSELEDVFGYDPATDGFIEIWVNGVKVVDHVGTTIYRYGRPGYQIRIAIVPKIGPYWSDAHAPQGDYFFDNYKVKLGPGTYNDVDPSQ